MPFDSSDDLLPTFQPFEGVKFSRSWRLEAMKRKDDWEMLLFFLIGSGPEGASFLRDRKSWRISMAASVDPSELRRLSTEAVAFEVLRPWTSERQFLSSSRLPELILLFLRLAGWLEKQPGGYERSVRVGKVLFEEERLRTISQRLLRRSLRFLSLELELVRESSPLDSWRFPPSSMPKALGSLAAAWLRLLQLLLTLVVSLLSLRQLEALFAVLLQFREKSAVMPAHISESDVGGNNCIKLYTGDVFRDGWVGG